MTPEEYEADCLMKEKIKEAPLATTIIYKEKQTNKEKVAVKVFCEQYLVNKKRGRLEAVDESEMFALLGINEYEIQLFNPQEYKEFLEKEQGEA